MFPSPFSLCHINVMYMCICICICMVHACIGLCTSSSQELRWVSVRVFMPTLMEFVVHIHVHIFLSFCANCFYLTGSMCALYRYKGICVHGSKGQRVGLIACSHVPSSSNGFGIEKYSTKVQHWPLTWVWVGGSGNYRAV
jgi:hypothetical protein